MTPPWVRIVIVAYNSGDWLARTVAALAVQTAPEFQVMIVDNASTDGAVDRLDLPDARFQMIRLPRNIGFAAASNRGAQGARTPWLAMLNPDAIPAPGWLAALKAATIRHKTASFFGSTQMMADDPDLADGLGDVYSIYGLAWRGGYGQRLPAGLTDAEVFSPCAAAALYERQAFQAAGGFSESFFCYLEDVDLAFRLRLLGHRAVQAADAVVFHKGSASTGRDSPFTSFHSSRNGMWLLVRCMPMPLLVLALPLYVAAQSALAARFRGGRARLHGLIAGVKGIGIAWNDRARIQSSRRLGWRQVARLMVWNPRHVLARRIVHDGPPLSSSGKGQAP
jgi:GT2 family glycosyltransferase